MAATKDRPGKKPRMVKQLIQIYRYTYAGDKTMPWLVWTAFVAPVVAAVVIGLIFRWSVITWIFVVITAVMLGMLLFTMVLTNRADRVGYAQLEGKPGAAIGILGNISKAGFSFPQEPVWIDPRTKDAIWRGTGYNGVYLLGEGNGDRLIKAMDRQERAIHGVTAGSSIPVYRIIVGTGPHDVKLKDLRRTVLRCKSYEPSGHTNGLLARIHPRRRFILTKPELATLNDRLRTLQLAKGYGVPKGIDPLHPPRMSRRSMRGR